jgi:hypothetical protein
MGGSPPLLSWWIINSPSPSVTVSGSLTRGLSTHCYPARPARRRLRRPSRSAGCDHRPHSADGAALKLDPARLVYSLRWLHRAEAPDFELVLLRDPELWG